MFYYFMMIFFRIYQNIEFVCLSQKSMKFKSSQSKRELFLFIHFYSNWICQNETETSAKIMIGFIGNLYKIQNKEGKVCFLCFP